MGKLGEAGARDGAGLRRRLLELLAGSVLVLLAVHLASVLAECAGQHRAVAGPCRAAGSADSSALGVAAPLLLGAVAAAAAWLGLRARAVALLRAAGAAALLALADALSLPARLGPGLVAALDTRTALGLAVPRLGAVLVGAAVVAAAVLLLAWAPGSGAAMAHVRRVLLRTVVALAGLKLLSNVAEGWLSGAAPWPALADAAEETGEGLVAAWAAAALASRLSSLSRTWSLSKTFQSTWARAAQGRSRTLALSDRKRHFNVLQ